MKTSLTKTAAPVELLNAGDSADARRWEALVSGSPFPDPYYRPGYVKAYEVEGHGRAVALLVRAGHAEFLFPMLLRPIAGTKDSDAITPYGYGGVLPLTSLPPSRPTLEATTTVLEGWCKSNGIVSLLLRFHPLLEQQVWFKPLLGENLSLRVFGPTTAVPLSGWSEASLRKGRRSDLTVARRSLRVTWSTRASGEISLEKALGIFRSLYEETMERVNAAAFYHFSAGYYAALSSGLGEDIAVALAWNGDQPAGGALFFAGPHAAHYHLSATNEAGRAMKATTLLIREGIEWARSRGCKRLHLGGGARGADTLFEFKKGFGGEVLEYAFAGLVTDRGRYDELVAARAATGEPLRPDFFPAYRA